MSQTHAAGTDAHPASPLMEVSNAMVTLHKEQFGRGPTQARASFAGRDALICVLDHPLLPAERQMVSLGQGLRVEETRLFFQKATSERFVATVEEIVGRKVRSFSSATDAANDVVVQIFLFHPLPAE